MENKKIKLIDLFNLILKNEQPVTVKIDYDEFYWDNFEKKYISKHDEEVSWKIGFTFNKKYLNKEIEISDKIVEPQLKEEEWKYLKEITKPIKDVQSVRKHNGNLIISYKKTEYQISKTVIELFEYEFKGLKEGKDYWVTDLGLHEDKYE